MLAFSEPLTLARARRQASDRTRFDRLIAEVRSRGWANESIDPSEHPLEEIAAPLFPITEFADAALALILPDTASRAAFVAPLLRTCELVQAALRANPTEPSVI